MRFLAYECLVNNIAMSPRTPHEVISCGFWRYFATIVGKRVPDGMKYNISYAVFQLIASIMTFLNEEPEFVMDADSHRDLLPNVLSQILERIVQVDIAMDGKLALRYHLTGSATRSMGHMFLYRKVSALSSFAIVELERDLAYSVVVESIEEQVCVLRTMLTPLLHFVQNRSGKTLRELAIYRHRLINPGEFEREAMRNQGLQSLVPEYVENEC